MLPRWQSIVLFCPSSMGLLSFALSRIASRKLPMCAASPPPAPLPTDRGSVARLVRRLALRGLRGHRDAGGDSTDREASRRDRQIKIVGGYAITFWLDAPAHIVMVGGVRPADK